MKNYQNLLDFQLGFLYPWGFFLLYSAKDTEREYDILGINVMLPQTEDCGSEMNFSQKFKLFLVKAEMENVWVLLCNCQIRQYFCVGLKLSF